jgi:hypothetical protein
VEQLARAFERRCEIAGVEYWLDATGTPLPARDDCFEYDPEAVEVAPTGARFVVRDPNAARPLATTAAEEDANDLEAVAAAFKRRCFIGRGQDVQDDIDEVLEPGGRRPGVNLKNLFRTSVMDYWEE